MRLLLAEDERDLASALLVILKHNRYTVDVVHDGNEALQYLRTCEYDGVILDIMMPGMDGLSVLRTVRAEGNRVPVLLLSAKSEVDDRVSGLDSGADDYLTKPFAMPELLARLRVLTRRQGTAVSSLLSLGNITLDRASFILSGPQGEFRLANKEFRIMELLMANPGQLMSSERLLERVWGYDSDVEVNVVWVYISYLRRKLSTIGSDVMICASRNAGYSLEHKQ